MTQKLIKTPSLSRIPTISGLIAESNSGGNLVNNTKTIPVYQKIFINSPYVIATNIWRIILRKEQKESDPSIIQPETKTNINTYKTKKTKAYEVEWGYFVDPSRLYYPDDRQRSYSSTSIIPFLKPIKEIDNNLYGGQHNYGLLYSVCNVLNKYKYDQLIQKSFVVLSITLLATISTYSLYKIY